MSTIARLLRGLLVIVAGIAISTAASTTAASAATFTYDAPALARVDAHASGLAEAGLGASIRAQEGSVSPSVEARDTSTTPLLSGVATNRAGMDSFLDNGATVHHSGTATAIGDDANTSRTSGVPKAPQAMTSSFTGKSLTDRPTSSRTACLPTRNRSRMPCSATLPTCQVHLFNL